MKLLLLTFTLILIGAGCTNTLQTGEIPTSIPTTQGRIDLSNRDLDRIPENTFSKTTAIELDVSNNKLTGSMQAEIRHLKKLKTLNASDNSMTGVPAEIGQLTELENLDLSNNQLTGLPYELGNLSKLRILDLRGNDISSIDIEIIRKALPSNTKILLD